MMSLGIKAAATLMTMAVVLSGCTLAPTGPVPASAGTGSSAAPATEATNRESATYQVLSGLGVNANVHSWRDGELKPAIDKIAELGDVTWRVIIDRADWDPTETAATDSIDWTHYTPIYSSGKMADLWNTIGYIDSKPGQQVSVNVMGGVPQWMGGDHIDADHEDQWVRMISSMVAYGRTTRHLDFTLLGPMNETDWNGVEGPKVPPAQYVRLLHKLIVSLDALGFDDMRLVGPDTASASKGVNEYLPALLKDPLVMSRLAHFAIHSYDGGAAGAAAALEEAGQLQKDLWVTEFSGPCPGCDDGSPHPGDWATASATAAHAISLLKQGAAGLQQYDAWDGYYEHHESMGYWGLLAYDAASGRYTPRKSYFVLRQLLTYLPRTAVRIAASSDDDRVSVVAFTELATGRVTFFGQNSSDQPLPVTLLAPQVAHMRLSAFSTDAHSDMEQGTASIISGGIAKYTARPGAVFTLTGIPTEG
jgi:hypothetical protein